MMFARVDGERWETGRRLSSECRFADSAHVKVWLGRYASGLPMSYFMVSISLSEVPVFYDDAMIADSESYSLGSSKPRQSGKRQFRSEQF